MSEVVGALADATLKPGDVAPALAVCSLLHQRYAEFAPQVGFRVFVEAQEGTGVTEPAPQVQRRRRRRVTLLGSSPQVQEGTVNRVRANDRGPWFQDARCCTTASGLNVEGKGSRPGFWWRPEKGRWTESAAQVGWGSSGGPGMDGCRIEDVLGRE